MVTTAPNDAGVKMRFAMDLKKCEKCGILTPKVYRASQYSDKFGFVCSKCFLDIIKNFLVPPQSGDGKYDSGEQPPA
jgi:hypothetical protein